MKLATKHQWISFTVTLLFNAQSYAVEVVDDLKLVQLIFRHGDRAPFHTYKTDPYGEAIWKYGLGRLTKIGMQQQYEAGNFYRQRYARFLDPTDGPNEVYIRSSDQDRSLQSAAAFAAGLFPPSTSTQWNEGLGQLWRPVSIHSVAWEEENLLSKQTSCPAYFRLHNETLDLPEARRMYKDHKAVFDYVTQQTGIAVTAKSRMSAWLALGAVRDVLVCQRANGYHLPDWMNETLFQQVNYLYDRSFHLFSGANNDRPRARLAGGNLLDLILKRMLDKTRNTTKPPFNGTKVFIYSGHDSTVAGLLSALELYDYNETVLMGVPNYASTVLIEMFTNDTVRLSLKDSPGKVATAEPIVLRHPRCDIFCPLDALIKETNDFVVSDWARECAVGQFGDGIDLDDVTIALVTVVLVIILTTIALGCYKRRRGKHATSSRTSHGYSDTAPLNVTYAQLDQDDQSV